MKRKFFSFATFDRVKRSNDTATVIVGDSMTKQSDRDGCDINKILARQGVHVANPMINPYYKEPMYGDFSGDHELRSMLDIIRTGAAKFDDLPPKIRKRFSSPRDLIDFLLDSDNRDEAIHLGLIDKIAGDKPAQSISEEPPKST